VTNQIGSSRRGFVALLVGAIGAVVGWGAARLGARGTRSQVVPTAPFRRVVTGFDVDGRSVITHDGPVPVPAQTCCSPEQIARAPYLKGISGNEIWLYHAVPADLADTRDSLTGELPTSNQPKRGSITARMVRYEPGVHYPMHATSTVDLGIVITGSLQLELEKGSTAVGPGDVVVQRGTPHAWRVLGDTPVVVFFFLVDAINARVTRAPA
jgi:quercetin dioxygenase-like cupin family protein